MPRKRITIAILALGGQGGGVFADWLVAVAERNGYFAQATSVPGVAQRTGSTVYYIELYPEEDLGGTPARAGADAGAVRRRCRRRRRTDGSRPRDPARSRDAANARH